MEEVIKGIPTHLKTVDFAVIVITLGFILIVGIVKGIGIKTMRDYTVGNKDFETMVLICALSATVMGGNSFLGRVEQCHRVGIIYFFVSLGGVFSMLMLGYFLGPKMRHFHDEISAGEVMARHYGKGGRIVTGFLGCIYCVGIIGVEIAALGYIFSYFTNVSKELSILIGFGIVVTYSAFGGIKAVTYTDFFQFLFIVGSAPAILDGSIHGVGAIDDLYIALKETHPAHINPFLDPQLLKKYLPIFFIFCIPSMNPAKMQRLLMAKGRQAKEVFIKTAYVTLFFFVVLTAIGIASVKSTSGVPPNLILLYLIKTFVPTFVKGMAVAGLLAAIMSTADSLLNSGSVSLVHDCLKPTIGKSWKDEDELKYVRITTVLMGILGILIATKLESLLSMFIFIKMFWMPLVVPALIGTVLGYKAEPPVFWGAMAGGLICLIFWGFFITPIWGVKPLLPATFCNALIFFGPKVLARVAARPFVLASKNMYNFVTGVDVEALGYRFAIEAKRLVLKILNLRPIFPKLYEKCNIAEKEEGSFGKAAGIIMLPYVLLTSFFLNRRLA